MYRLVRSVLPFCLVAVGCTVDDDTANVKKTVTDYMAALKAGDDEKVAELLTESMAREYREQKKLLDLAGKLTNQPRDPASLELTSVSVDRIEGDTAYVNTEVKHGETTRFERLVLKRSGSGWKIAGKQ
jgi:hypothetical protein